MSAWHPQHFKQASLMLEGDSSVIDAAVAVGRSIVSINPQLTPVFTLRHLAHLTDVKYEFLRDVVARRIDPYRSFRIAKSRIESTSDSFRLISVPNFELMVVQRWILSNILQHGRPHEASAAYAPECDIRKTAMLHCEARWLIKLDIKRFFESISEIAAYRVFRSLGYQPLVAFEMSRLCTRFRKTFPANPRPWASISTVKWTAIPAYGASKIGYLPQGAPTSPMLANLAVKELDRRIFAISEKCGLMYTRYADDLAFSTKKIEFTRSNAANVIGNIYRTLGDHGFSPNLAKAHVISPGARKVVLGLIVNGKVPRLTREFRGNLRMHIYYLKTLGPMNHQLKRKFVSVRSLRNHVEGLVNFAHHIDPAFAKDCRLKLAEVRWPL